MTLNEKLAFIESALGAPENSLLAEMPLSDVPQWDSLSMMNLQIECTVRWPHISFDDLHTCATVGDICDICE